MDQSGRDDTMTIDSDEDRLPDAEELELIAALSEARIRAIDAALLAAASADWRKLALLVAHAMTGPARVPGIPDVYYSQRVARLVAEGMLEPRGDLSRMRYCEIRLSRQPSNHQIPA